MTLRSRVSISVALLTLSVTAFAAAAASNPVTTGGSPPLGLLTGALICVVLTLLVWSDDLDRSSVRRSRAQRVENGSRKI